MCTGADMNELYVYNHEKHAWAFVSPRGKKPAPRYLHTAVVVADAMLVFGGTQKTAGDVWSFSFRKLAWTRLSHVRITISIVSAVTLPPYPPALL